MCSIDTNCIFNNSYKNNFDMKANEEPEKIYCIPTEGGCYYITTIKPEPPFAEGVEYIRTDAFIKKALRWMISQGGVNDALSREMIEDFKEAMKL